MTRVPGRLSRRSLLAVAGAAAGVTSLSGCSGSTTQHEPDNESRQGGAQQGDWNPEPGVGGPGIVAEATDIPVGGGKVYPYKQLVVVQPTANVFHGYKATCTYQPCALSGVQDGLIICPCHGCRYSITDGSVRTGPATRPLEMAEITLDAGQIRLLV